MNRLVPWWRRAHRTPTRDSRMREEVGRTEDDDESQMSPLSGQTGRPPFTTSTLCSQPSFCPFLLSFFSSLVCWQRSARPRSGVRRAPRPGSWRGFCQGGQLDWLSVSLPGVKGMDWIGGYMGVGHALWFLFGVLMLCAWPCLPYSACVDLH